MARREENVVLTDQIGDHPAVRAWRAFEGGVEPTTVEVLKPEKRRSAVFRLNGIGPAGASVIAKRRQRGELDLEHRLYAEILPSLSLPALAVLGVHDAPDDRSWIFLEDAGEQWYEPKAPEHRALAVHWLADLHTRSSGLSASIPDTGSSYFRAVLEAGLDGLRTGLDHPDLSPPDRAVLRSIASLLERVRERWGEVDAECRAAPRCLVHGDFVPKNVRIRRGRGGLEIVAFDWETAGVASPAADIGMLPEQGDSLRLYHALVSGIWPGLDWEGVQRLARTGRLLRLLNCVHWEARSFLYPWIEHTMRRMRSYEQALQEALESSVPAAG